MTRTAMIPRPVEATLQVVLATGEVVADLTDNDLAPFGLVDSVVVVQKFEDGLTDATRHTFAPVGDAVRLAASGQAPSPAISEAINDLAGYARSGKAHAATAGADANLGPVTVNEEFGEEPAERERLFDAVPAKVKWAVLSHYLQMAQAADSPPLTVLRAQHDALDRQVRPWEYEQPKAS